DGGNGCGSNGIAVTSGYGMTCLTVDKIRVNNGVLQKWSIVSYTCTNGGNPNDNCGRGLTGGRYKIANYDWVNVTEANVLTGATNNYDGNDGGNGCGSNGIAVTSGYGMTCLTVDRVRIQSTCSTGSVLENNQCKTSVTKCPVGYTETAGAEVSKGECKGNIDYSYYEYKCNEDKNGQNNNYQIINNGGDCN
ncbi:hypothetical protein ACOL23_12200, partial [Aliarcobacter butzleri]